MINLTYKGQKHEFRKGVTAEHVLEELDKGRMHLAVAVLFNNTPLDLKRKLEEDGELKLLTTDDKEGMDVFRHSSAHVLAQAIMHLYPQAKLTIGPVVEEGFYYDIDMQPLTPEDAKKIEEEMEKIVKENLPITREELSKAEALERFKGNEYKEEMIKELEGNISVYTQGEFSDLCRGPHLPRTGMIKAFKITKIAGAYWRGKAENKQLQRIYGISFPDRKQLKEYLFKIEEAAKRDHKKLGRELDLFSIHEEGPGMPFFHPKGMSIWDELMKYWHEVHKRAGYVQVKTPLILNRKLWETSGHWMNYRENMYTTNIDGQDFAIKPMNCPGGMLLYKEKVHSYKELPIRQAEIGLVHRHELSGVLNGLFRVRCFNQDDAHIFMSADQAKDEILGVLKLAEEIYATFGLTYHLELSTRPEKSIGTDEQWEIATNSLREALESYGKPYKINEGDGAFYGPKIDIHIKDAIGRTWQCGTIQFDMAFPERFDLTYDGPDGRKHRPIMIHRVIYGAVERFYGLLIEHYAGKFPLWLSPVQVKILTIADRHEPFAQEVLKHLLDADIRAELDSRAESVNKKIREAQLQKINYMLVIGDKEVEAKNVNVRTREEKILGSMPVEDIIKKLREEISKKV
ncbi:MAG: threonine--tRNA ligase [archaeon]